MKSKKLGFSQYFINNYPKIRGEVESDLRDVYRKTKFERKSECIEINYDEIFLRLASNYSLKNNQIQFLKKSEFDAEIQSVKPITSRIERLISLAEDGHDVILISDMYLPFEAVKQLINKADSRLDQFKLYLSSEIGHQKSTTKLYKHIFFDLDYKYAEWTHFGDNFHADHNAAKKMGINAIHHNMSRYIPFEKGIVEKFNNFDGYKIAGMLLDKRWSLLSKQTMEFDEKSYYSYSYVGSILVPYVYWSVLDAVKKGYKTLYFISRDGHYLKKIADIIIKENRLNINAEYIYGSRKAWRLAAQIDKIDDEIFSEFGLFSTINSYDDLIKCSQLAENELLTIIPSIAAYKGRTDFRGKISDEIRCLFKQSEKYKKRLLEIGAKDRELVEIYLREHINPNEKFAFVEFWGRGYTQDLLARLLNNIYSKNVNTIFYYARNYSPNFKNSIRHRFTQKPMNFTFVEAIFSSTPYKSISKYIKDSDENVIPEIILDPNNISDVMEQELENFTRDLMALELADIDSSIRCLFDYATDYHTKKFNDQFIINIYSNLKDSVNPYGEVTTIAPPLSIDILENASIAELKKYTSNIGQSIIKSSKDVQNLYLKKCKIEKVAAAPSLEIKKIFPVNDLNNYLKLKNIPSFVKIKLDSDVYNSVEFINETKNLKKLYANDIVKVIDVIWNHAGIPRLLTNYGYITAHKSFITEVNNTSELFKLAKTKREVFKNLDLNFDDIAFISKSDKTLENEKLLKGVLDVTSGLTKNTLNSSTPNKIRSDIENYVTDLDAKNVYTLSKLKVYQDLGLKNPTGRVIEPYQICTPLFIQWTKGGTPRIELVDGFITANKKFIKLVNKDFEAPVTPTKIRSDIENYITDLESKNVMTLSKIKVYNDLNFKIPTGKTIEPNQVCVPLSIQWSKGGTPRIEIEDGYITTNKKFIQLTESKGVKKILNHKVRSDIENYFTKLDGKYVYSLSKLNIYEDIGLTIPTGKMIDIHQLCNPLSIQWTKGGTPRIKLNEGFITANKKFVVLVTANHEYVV